MYVNVIMSKHFNIFSFPCVVYVVQEEDVHFCKLGVSCNPQKGWANSMCWHDKEIKMNVNIFHQTLIKVDFVVMAIEQNK